MKKLMNQLTLLVIVCAAMLVIQSCNSSDNDDRYVVYATVKYLEGTNNQKDLVLYSESNKVEFFIEEAAFTTSLSAGQRLIADVTVLSGDLSVDKKCTARLNGLELVQTKNVEILAKGEQDIYGTDRVGLYGGGTTGLDGYYLNVLYSKYGENSEIALVLNENRDFGDDNYLNLELRYNAKGVPLLNYYPSRVSFNLSSIPDIDFSKYKGVKIYRKDLMNNDVTLTLDFPKVDPTDFTSAKSVGRDTAN